MAIAQTYMQDTMSGLPTPTQLLDIYTASLEEDIASGSLRPVVFPHMIYSLLLTYAFLLIPHVRRPWLYACRWPLMAFICWMEYRNVLNRSCVSGGAGFASGLITMWLVIWCATWLIFERPQFEAKRIQRQRKNHVNEKESSHLNGLALQSKNSGDDSTISKTSKTPSNRTPSDEDRWQYSWQPYPDNLKERLSWTADLLLNFRGPGWNWVSQNARQSIRQTNGYEEVTSNPSLPPHILKALDLPVTASSISGCSKAGICRFTTRQELQKYIMPRFLCGLLALDVFKVAFMKDPYFMVGPNSYPLPPHLAWLNPMILEFLRKVSSLVAIVVSLDTIFMTSPVVFCLLLGPERIGLKGEAWYYSSNFGSFSCVTSRGLAGFWGGWWHQTFRKGFSAPTNFAIRKGWITKHSIAAKIAGMGIAFLLSGAIHASGSFTQIPDTYPRNLMYFFVLQMVGVVVQEVLKGLSSGVFCYLSGNTSVPRNVSQATNFIYVATWLLLTSSLITDEFARGLWLFEPVAISPLRALGFGYNDEGLFVKTDLRHLHLYGGGSRWWEAGIRI